MDKSTKRLSLDERIKQREEIRKQQQEQLELTKGKLPTTEHPEHELSSMNPTVETSRGRKKSVLDSSIVRTTGNIEEDDKKETDAYLNAADQIKADMIKVSNPHYTLVLVFVTRDQAFEFLTKTGWGAFQPDGKSKFLDGLAIAESMGIQLTPEKVRFKSGKADKRLIDEVGLIPE